MSWNFRCLGKGCQQLYTTHSSEPGCPKCGSKRARWVPRSVSVARTRQGVDRDLRQLASDFGYTDLHSARLGEAARPKPRVRSRVPYSPSAGWSIEMPTDERGALQPTCAPAGVTSKVVAEVGKVQPRSAKLGGPRPIIEASHKAQIPRA